MPKNHLGEPSQQTYGAWRSAAKKAGATKFEGDKDICSAKTHDDQHVGQWEGDSGSISKRHESIVQRILAGEPAKGLIEAMT